MLRTCTLFLAMVLASAGGVLGQTNPDQSRGRDQGPVSVLLEHQRRLRLSTEQVTALRGIEAEMNRLNRPLVSRLSSIRRNIKSLGPVDSLTVEQKERFDGYMAELRPVVDQIQANNWAAMRRVGEVLTVRQRERLSRLLQDLNDDDRGRSGNNPGPPSPRD